MEDKRMSSKIKMRIISFSPPDVGMQEVEEISKAICSDWITTGIRTKELEKKIVFWIGVDKAACLNSQTVCAETELRFLGIGAGDEVVTCAYTYTANVSVVNYVCAKKVLEDCQKNSLFIDYDAVEAAITEKTIVIIPIDLVGIPCDYDRLFEIEKRKKHFFICLLIFKGLLEGWQFVHTPLMRMALYGMER